MRERHGGAGVCQEREEMKRRDFISMTSGAIVSVAVTPVLYFDIGAAYQARVPTFHHGGLQYEAFMDFIYGLPAQYANEAWLEPIRLTRIIQRELAKGMIIPGVV